MVMSGVYWPGGLSNFETVNGGTEPVLVVHWTGSSSCLFPYIILSISSTRHSNPQPPDHAVDTLTITPCDK